MAPFLLLALALGQARAGEPAAGARVSTLVVLREQAELSGASRLRDRLERRRYVYETLKAQAEATQPALVRELERRGVPVRPHFLVNALEVEADPETAAWLAARPEVARLSPNRPAALRRVEDLGGGVESAPRASGGVEPNLALIGASFLWDLGVTGEGIVIGVADTGFDWQHPALKERYRGWNGVSASHDYNWHDAVHHAASDNACGSDVPEPCDDYSHGTGTAGLALGRAGDDTIGVAPGARLIGCRNMEAGNGTPARYLECFEWFLAPTDLLGANPLPELGPDVVNNSWSCPPSEGCADPDVMNSSVDAMRAAGIAMSFSAGNQGNTCGAIANAPAIAPGSFAVTATALDDTIAAFASFGPVTSDGSNRLKPDLAAPGVNVRTAGLGGVYLPRFTGTSAAAPHVAGAFALLWSGIPELRGDLDATEDVVRRAAVPLTSTVDCGGYSGTAIPNPVFGWGRLDVAHAYILAIGRAPILAAPEDRATRALPPR